MIFTSSDRVTPEMALEVADRIGARLVRDAVRDGNRATWLGDHMEPLHHQWQPVLKPCGADLYSGTPGIGMFLARLFKLTGEPLFRATADAAFEHALSMRETTPPEVRGSVWSGWAGTARAMIDAGGALDAAAWLERGLELAAAVARLDPELGGLDVMGGSAGVIPFLLDVHRRHGLPLALDAAVRHGERLLSAANRSDHGLSWTTMPQAEGFSTRDLTGLSHGAGGVALALFELAAVTGDARFTDAAERGVAYEQHWFSPRHRNWPDFRELPIDAPEAQWGWSATWCHGAPGIALARLRAWELTRRPEYREQAEAALHTTAATLQTAAPGMESWCLCHGTAGNADVLLVAAERLGDSSWQEAVASAAARGVATYEQGDLPWPPGVTGGVDNPSLMLGSAGTGWFFLRLAAPTSIPSVLTP
jgi:class II lanthipeptide synthase